mmetsp:Transcript_7848/g.18296  ORF Transcript_7848/g.18296 Transcript_7848/m.18296 type:complete len:313 (+) Transcript_7848:30-968(+)
MSSAVASLSGPGFEHHLAEAFSLWGFHVSSCDLYNSQSCELADAESKAVLEWHLRLACHKYIEKKGRHLGTEEQAKDVLAAHDRARPGSMLFRSVYRDNRELFDRMVGCLTRVKQLVEGVDIVLSDAGDPPHVQHVQELATGCQRYVPIDGIVSFCSYNDLKQLFRPGALIEATLPDKTGAGAAGLARNDRKLQFLHRLKKLKAARDDELPRVVLAYKGTQPQEPPCHIDRVDRTTIFLHFNQQLVLSLDRRIKDARIREMEAQLQEKEAQLEELRNAAAARSEEGLRPQEERTRSRQRSRSRHRRPVGSRG